LYLKGYTAKRLKDEFPEKKLDKVLVLISYLTACGTHAQLKRRPGSGKQRSARTEENAKLLLQKFPQSATDFVLAIVR